MRISYRTAAAAIGAVTLGVAAFAYAESAPTGDGNSPHGMWGMHHGMMGAMGRHGGMGPGGAQIGAMQSLMTPEERTAFGEKMRSAKTPEERQKLADANHVEMQKRAKEKGITLPEQAGPGHMRW